MKGHSLKIKLTIIMAALVTSVVALICILNATLFERYYMNERINELKSSYDSLKSTITSKSEDDVLSEIQSINARHNISVFVVDSRWQVAYSSQNSNEDAVKWFKNVLFNSSIKKKIIENSSDYMLVRSHDSVTNMSFLEMYGVLSDGTQIIMQITIDSIKENVNAFNRFVIIVGAAILVVSMVVVYAVASGFTKPVKKLSQIAEQMSEMNFDIKYQGEDKSEIGLLGHSMNIMSDKLEENISELKKANIELKRDIEIKTKNEEMRREFLSNVSHELKTPIALIQGYAEGLKEGVSDDEESREFYCDVIMDEAAKMNSMVKKLLTLNQIEFGNNEENIERFNITELINSIVRNSSIILEQKGIKVVFDPETPHMVWADNVQLEEVVTNYFTNAINHCDYDKIIKISIAQSDDNEKAVRISVFNTGDQIPDEDIDRIWEKFYKVDKARTREYGGNGIGLSIVKAILDRTGQKYGVMNCDGGVQFWFDVDAG